MPATSVTPREAHRSSNQPPKQHASQIARTHAKAIAARQLSWRVGPAPSKRAPNTAVRDGERRPDPATWCPLWPPASSLHEHPSSAIIQEDVEASPDKPLVRGIGAQDGMHAYCLALYLTEARPRPGKCPGWTMDPFCPLETRPEERILFQHCEYEAH